jgi:hypothetical protein
MSKKTDAQRIAKLERELAALKAAQAPPKPFKPEPWQQFDPTTNMSMPRSTLMEMAAAIPDHMIKGIVRDNQAPQGPSAGGIPSSQQITSVHPGGGARLPAGGGTGWAREVPFGPSMHQRYVDAQLDAQDAKDRAARIAEDRALRDASK